jgi:uncharacterized protein YdeI (YjbR/CyaY-like superfamily)
MPGSDRRPADPVPDGPRPLVSASNRAEWRRWLKTHHAREHEVWLIYYKKHTAKATISYRESVEEALCFGWIDGLKKRIDDERYAHRFTPRRAKSKWSPLNISLAQELIASKKMTRAGLAAFEQRRNYEEAFLKTREAGTTRLPPEIEKILKANHAAWENFNRLAPGYRKQYTGWLCSAKKPETRERRLKEAIRLLKQNKKLEMK